MTTSLFVTPQAGVGQTMRRASWLTALLLALAAVIVWMVPNSVIPIEAVLVEARAGARTRLDPSPTPSFSTVTFVVDAPDSVREIAVEHVAYGELRVAPAGPYFPLTGADPTRSKDGRIRCELVLSLSGADRPTSETLRDMLRRQQKLEVRMRVFNGSRVVAESGWMDASASLASIADQLR